MATDGKYLTLAVLKQYLQGTRTDPSNPTVFNGQVTGTPDDNLMYGCILEAEASFDQMCGTGFDQQTYTQVQAFMSYVDGNGWLHLFARERGPVTAVSAVQVRDIFLGGTAWQTVTFISDDLILPPYSALDTYPRPESWHVQIWPTPPQYPRAAGQLLVRWSYTAGFAVIPQSLQFIIARMATFIYKMREAPIGKVINQPLGTMTVPANYPPDLIKAIKLWEPTYG